MQSPLHVAVKMGHLKFVEKILSVKPEMAEVVDQIKRSTPLHIAAARKERAGLAEAAGQDHIAAAGKEREGLAKAAAQDHIAAAAAGKERAGLAKAAVQDNEKIIEILLEVAPNMCFVHDQDGMTPLHVAAVNGNTEVLKQLLKKKRQAALERTTKGETILHLCVKNCQVDTLEALVKDTYDLELLNSGDNDGNTVLHLAVAYKEFKMLKFLLDQGDDKIDKNALNKKNRTMKDIFHLTESAKDSRDKKTLT
ncbi:ankyrin repeat-containing protein At5g02620-like [Chenopodium quinoa]|uniref:ankyrin repeat-containing protein At5g02620-like n=1 Tax=Chenopodium quinoa TaxID=63459 RepID=UPI000B78B3D2|nr:ankyrin repeat-containing protein At5g02620-like [Chenopodium quinoa]